MKAPKIFKSYQKVRTCVEKKYPYNDRYRRQKSFESKDLELMYGYAKWKSITSMN